MFHLHKAIHMLSVMLKSAACNLAQGHNPHLHMHRSPGSAHAIHTLQCGSHRLGHETQWTHSKLAEPCDEEVEEESLDACWNCVVPLNIDSSSQAVHLGVYAVQSSQAPTVHTSSSSFLSTVCSQLTMQAPVHM